MKRKGSDDRYSERESVRRFDKTLMAALNTAPRPLKGMTSKRPKAQHKTKKS